MRGGIGQLSGRHAPMCKFHGGAESVRKLAPVLDQGITSGFHAVTLTAAILLSRNCDATNKQLPFEHATPIVKRDCKRCGVPPMPH
jgi:hypothetical protein